MNLETATREGRLLGARAWLGLGVLSLVVAGVFAVILVVGRTPPLDRLFADPLFFRRGLVVHVNLSLLIWFHAFATGLSTLLPGRPGTVRLPRLGAGLAAAGIVLACVAAAVPGAVPVLSNYVPAIDHPLFVAGMVTFGAGVLASFADGRLRVSRDGASPLPDVVPDAAHPALRAAAVSTLLAALTFLASALTTPGGLPPERRWELLAWGGGHVLVFASVAAMLAAWMILVGSAVGRSSVSRRASTLLFACWTAPLLIAPVIALRGTTLHGYRGAFTALMQVWSWPVPLVVMALCARALIAARREGRLPAGVWSDAGVLAFVTSAGLTLVGFVLGGLIRGSSTIIPGHYHASIGAVTVAFMASTYALLEPLGLRALSARSRRLARWQPVLFGAGQLAFAAGFALAGAHGMARKVYGVEQVRSGVETAGLAIMGAGGFVAVAGGLLYLGLAATAWRAKKPARAAETSHPVVGSNPWTPPLAPSTPSRS